MARATRHCAPIAIWSNAGWFAIGRVAGCCCRHRRLVVVAVPCVVASGPTIPSIARHIAWFRPECKATKSDRKWRTIVRRSNDDVCPCVCCCCWGQPQKHSGPSIRARPDIRWDNNQAYWRPPGVPKWHGVEDTFGWSWHCNRTRNWSTRLPLRPANPRVACNSEPTRHPRIIWCKLVACGEEAVVATDCYCYCYCYDYYYYYYSVFDILVLVAAGGATRPGLPTRPGYTRDISSRDPCVTTGAYT